MKSCLLPNVFDVVAHQLKREMVSDFEKQVKRQIVFVSSI